MLNEERVKHMVKLAAYETKSLTKDYKVSSYHRKDYISFNVLCTLIWFTVGFLIIVGGLGLAYMDVILADLTLRKGILLVVSVIVGYIVLLVAYGACSYRHYKKKHLQARYNIKMFGKNLDILEEMYEREDA